MKSYIIKKLKAWGFVLLYLAGWFPVVALTHLPLPFFSTFIKIHSNDFWLLFSTTVTLGGTLLLTWFFCKFFHKETWFDTGLSFSKERWKDLWYGLLYGAAAIIIGFGICYFTGAIQITGADLEPISITRMENTESPSGTTATLPFLPAIILPFLSFILVAFNEEIMFRGYILRRFMSAYHPYAALFISSIFFMLMHSSNDHLTFLGFFNLFLAGVLLGVYYIHRQNLWFPIGLHFSWNFFQGPLFGFAVSGSDTFGSIIKQQTISGKDWLTGGTFGFEGSVWCSLLIVVMIGAIHFQYRKKAVSAPAVPEENQDIIN